jgi:hypothetical protein
MSGDFGDAVKDGVTARHPIKGTIHDLRIVEICPAHEQYARAMPDTSSFFDKEWLETDGPNAGVRWYPCDVPPPANCLPIENAKVEQHRGYLLYPIRNPTSAQCLYTWFCIKR